MGVALVTPFTKNDEVDYAALEKLVQMHIDSGTSFLCVQGTTAETPTLTIEEKREIRKRIIKQVDGRMPIMLGVGGNCTRAVVNELQTEDLTGVDAILSVAPYYNKPVQEGIYQHYKAIANATELPIYMYNVPGRTGVNILPSTVVRVANECPNIVGYKAASGNLAQVKELIAKKNEAEEELATIKANILSSMEFLDVRTWVTDNVRVTRKMPSTRFSFDLKRFKEVHSEITDYDDYMKPSNVAGSLLVAI